MEFVVIPSNRTSYGVPQVKGRSWIGLLMLVQATYLVGYSVIDRDYLKIVHDPFDCSKNSCLSPHFAILMDWFISSLSVVLPLITDELLFEDFVYFSYHYIVFIRLFLLYRVSSLALLLPKAGLPSYALTGVLLLHVLMVMIILRIFYVLLKEIEKSKTTLIAIQIMFSKFGLVSLVKVFRSIEGSSKALSPPIHNTIPPSVEICPICFEALTILGSRSTNSLRRTRVNASVNRPQQHGSLHIFSTQCNHAFHRDCLMKWIIGKPIRVDLAQEPDISDYVDNGRRSGASCPVCGRRVQLRIERETKLVFEYIWNNEL